MKRTLIVLMGAVVGVTACTTTPVIMRHADGRVAKCGPYDARPINSFSSAERERGCVADYQRQGFERAPE